MTTHASLDEVHRFWFADTLDDPAAAIERNKIWFGTSAQFDDACGHFEPAIGAAARGELDEWERTPRSSVSLVIVLDQFPRNVYRGTAAAFAHDALALQATRRALAAGHLDRLSVPERAFLLMPFQHVEDVAIQREGVALFEHSHAAAPAEWKTFAQNNLDFARKHLEIVERFGRFPHRNAVLGRPSTAEEVEYLASKPDSFGQG